MSVHPSTNRLTVQQPVERARMETSPSPVNETATLSAAHKERVITVPEETSTLVPIQGMAGRRKLAPTLDKRVSHAKRNMITEESEKNTAEPFTSNQQSPVISAEENTPQTEKDRGQICKISDNVMKELPVASGSERVMRVVTPKKGYMLSPHRIQVKLGCERTKSSLLPEISGEIFQTTREKAKTQEALQCRSREISLKERRVMTVYQKAEKIQNSSENLLGSTEKCRRNARQASSKLSGRYVTLPIKTQKSTQNLTESDIQHKEADIVAETTEVKFKDNSPATANHSRELEIGIDQCHVKRSGKEFHLKNEIKPVTPQRFPKSRIPKLLQKSSLETSEGIANHFETLQITKKSATSQASLIERKSQNSPKMGALNCSTKEEAIQTSSDKAFIQNSTKTTALNIPGSKESLNSHQSEKKVYNSLSERKLPNGQSMGKSQKSESMEKLHHSLTLGKLHSLPDKSSFH